MQQNRLAIALCAFLALAVQVFPGVQLLAPNGGETWYKGSTYTVRWSALGLEGEVRIVLLKGGVQQLIIHSYLFSPKSLQDHFSWTVPSDLENGSDYKMRITGASGDALASDDSNDNFTIKRMTMMAPPRPWVSILAPNGGERQMKASNCRIRWRSNVDFSRANISIKKGGDTQAVFNNVACEGPFHEDEWAWNWAVPNDIPDGDDYRVFVQGGGGGLAIDQSDAPFTVTGKNIDVIAPRAGDIWYRTSNQMIAFSCTGISQNLKVYASGYAYNPIAENVRPGAGEVMWTDVGRMGEVIIGGTERIVVETMDGSVRGESQRFVLETPTISVTRPEAGGRLDNGSSYIIRWDAPHVGSQVMIELLHWGTHGTWESMSLISSGTDNDGSFSWTVALPESGDYKIRVKAINQWAIFGESGIFTYALHL